MQEWETTQNGCKWRCAMDDDANCFHMIPLELKTTVNEKYVSVKSTVNRL